ncbi:uncharacterized protein LOC115625591 [Scaptodrosophila lebanonensis]|uniref:Purine nucleoside phosphorylase n=1 Tax=Drosophila lebanonensis TaxID=7225 RepID=A0A6J2TM31_DROLE|nr:uncharacterized protein LOC115625591 [Scaptodrosophila lebanonensis]
MCSPGCCTNKRVSKLRKTVDDDAPPKLIVPTPQSLLYSYEACQEAADFITKNSETRPKFGIICGSGLNALAEMLENPMVFPFADIPHFVEPDEDHPGKVFVGTLRGATVMAIQGRFQLYEGYTMAKSVMPVRVMKLCGVEYLFSTNAASATNPQYGVGDIMLLRDHINLAYLLTGVSPLHGPNEKRFGTRFPVLVDAYDPTLIEKALGISNTLGLEDHVHVGIYSCLGGPFYETVAEQNVLQLFGTDAVGMSTVHEVITARHCNIKVFAFSIITSTALDSEGKTEHHMSISEVTHVTKLRQQAYCELIARLIYEVQNAA